MNPVLLKPPGVHADSNVHYQRWRRRSFIRRLLELHAAEGLAERQRIKIAFAESCRRDSTEVLHADHIRRHTLIDDNPCSG